LRREIKRFARNEHETVVTVPLVVGMTVVAVEPTLIVIAFHVEYVEVAVRVGSFCMKYHLYHHFSK
jgi:hypothetical protein